MPAPTLESEADPDKIHQIVVEAMEALTTAMSEIRHELAGAIRAEGITYIFDW